MLSMLLPLPGAVQLPGYCLRVAAAVACHQHPNVFQSLLRTPSTADCVVDPSHEVLTLLPLWCSRTAAAGPDPPIMYLDTLSDAVTGGRSARLAAERCLL